MTTQELGVEPAHAQQSSGSSVFLAGVFRNAMLAGQLGLLFIVIRQFELVNSAFLRVALLAFVGFFIHKFLPLRLRQPFFLILSLVGILAIFGITAGAWLIGIGLALVSISYLPVSFRARIGLLVAATVGLILSRGGWIETPWPVAIWPILGSMFMFRYIVFLYDTREDCGKEPITRTLSYFFMLPNVCFPLFPVVDYARFRRNYFDEDADETYRVGIQWMLRGATHLIAYRIVYLYGTIAPSEVADGLDLLRYLVATFLLYLQVSGQFHFIVGMLHLFGYNLPLTNNKYLLASSFNDFWRRINIYWKDFMLKVFYYPIYFKLRGLGESRAIVLSTIIVFVATWLLHSYQWFWLRGSFPLVWQDGVYWMILAVLVAANSLYEIKYGKKGLIAQDASPLLRSVLLALRILGTMTVVLVLWSVWMAESLSAWTALWVVL